LVPSDSTNPGEEQQLEEKKISTFLNFAKNLPNNRIFKNEFKLEVEVVSDYIGNSNSASRSVGDIGTLQGASESEDEILSELVSTMRRPNSGLDIRDRRKTITRRTMRRCFVAKELVDWIYKNAELPAHTRECAIELAQKLLRRGYLKPLLSNSGTFVDGTDLFRFTDDQTLVNIRKASKLQKKHKPIRREPERPRSRSRIITKELDPAPLRSSSETKFPSLNGSEESAKHHSMEYKSPPKVMVEASTPPSISPACRDYFLNNTINSIKIQVEERTKKTDRYQWIAIEYDKLYYPACCYHIGIKWMICTGSAIQGVIAHLERHAKQCGVSIVQVPVEREHIGSAFRTSVAIEVPTELDKHSLLLRFGFLLDRKIGDSLEYMHRTGVAFIRCTPEGFVWNYNYTPTLQPQMHKALSLLKELIDVCENLSDSEMSDDDCVPNIFFDESESTES